MFAGFSGDIRRYQWLDLDGFTVNFFLALPLPGAPLFFFSHGRSDKKTEQLGPMTVVRLKELSGAITQSGLE